ncbi:hypothetical protein AAG570_003950 [Ranatra chinensis]|uniref:Lipase domain-containing protein n=1 Tax=Ranatra chinensis TaxID=642074 RepID=A0ABD0YQW7_9HEMI
MSSAYMKYRDYNIISVDWSSFAVDLYSMARIGVDIVAPSVADLYDYVVDEMGAHPSDVHVIGHSLGAHVAGIAAKLMRSPKLGRITGLDPALPLFFLGQKRRLDAEDAMFVDVVHTSIVGFRKPMGHADFYPNGDKLQQPGCGFSIGVCAHDRAYQYYIESIWSEIGFQALECPSWNDFLLGKCRGNAVVKMGEPLSPR